MIDVQWLYNYPTPRRYARVEPEPDLRMMLYNFLYRAHRDGCLERRRWGSVLRQRRKWQRDTVDPESILAALRAPSISKCRAEVEYWAAKGVSTAELARRYEVEESFIRALEASK
jgi:hypothetical protein